MKKLLSHTFFVIGAVLLMISIALPAYIVPSGRKIPLNISSTSTTYIRPAILLSTAALEKNEPVGNNKEKSQCRGEHKPIMCFILTEVELQSQSHIHAEEPSDENKITIEAANTLFQKNLEEPQNSLSTTIDRIQLDRNTSMPVPDPVSTLDVNTPTLLTNEEVSTPAFPRTGLQYQFPSGTDRKSYPYFDLLTLSTNDIDFVAEEEFHGEKVYRFEQTIQPTELYHPVENMLRSDGFLSETDKSVLSSLRLSLPATQWGLAPQEVEDWGNNTIPEDQGPDVEMSRYYTVNRVLRVQPDTGMILYEAEEVWMYYARDDQEAQKIAQPDNRAAELAKPTRTAIYFPGEWNEETQKDRVSAAQESLSKLTLLGTTMPLIFGALGTLLIVIGFVLYNSLRRSHISP